MDAQKTRAAAETHARRRRRRRSGGRRRTTHARTHTGMKFSDTSFARWRHQVRRRLAVAGRGREGGEEGEKGLMMVAERVGGSVIKLMIVE